MSITLTPAFVEMAEDTSPETLDVFYRSTGRRLLFGSKSARLLRVGDRVAVRDLHPDRAEPSGVATVVGLSTRLSSGAVFVITAERGVFLTPGSRLVLVHYSTSSAGTA
ncbi:hypothetical protein ACFRQM_24765 [Streptomyces sp. NPDC056831]|uniref:hypothetical protein n=1 Tax=Streptomyces sp. NPDC056831 TaxID=3345954 RepID=UPI00369AA6E2